MTKNVEIPPEDKDKFKNNNQPIEQYVIYMGREPLATPHKIDLPGFKYEYTLINLADLPYELFLTSREPEKQILAVLANTGTTSTAQVVKSVLEKVAVTNPEGSANNKCYEQLRVIMQLHL